MLEPLKARVLQSSSLSKLESFKTRSPWQARIFEKAGAFAIVLECINAKLAKKITNSIKIPTIGIGSSNYCDWQILVVDDLIGLSGFYPKFVKKYINLEEILDKTFNKFKKEVRRNKFPNKKNNY